MNIETIMGRDPDLKTKARGGYLKSLIKILAQYKIALSSEQIIAFMELGSVVVGLPFSYNVLSKDSIVALLQLCPVVSEMTDKCVKLIFTQSSFWYHCRDRFQKTYTSKSEYDYVSKLLRPYRMDTTSTAELSIDFTKADCFFKPEDYRIVLMMLGYYSNQYLDAEQCVVTHRPVVFDTILVPYMKTPDTAPVLSPLSSRTIGFRNIYRLFPHHRGMLSSRYTFYEHDTDSYYDFEVTSPSSLEDLVCA